MEIFFKEEYVSSRPSRYRDGAMSARDRMSVRMKDLVNARGFSEADIGSIVYELPTEGSRPRRCTIVSVDVANRRVCVGYSDKEMTKPVYLDFHNVFVPSSLADTFGK